MVSAAAQRIIEEMRSQMGGPLLSLEDERSGWEAFVKGEKLPEGTLVSGVSLNGVDCEWVERSDSDTGVVVLIHGGGFTSGSPRTHRKFAATFAKACGHRVLVPDYRLAPENPYPAGLDDIIAVYAALIEDGVPPESVAFTGDSSGGGLALSAAIKLRDIGAPLPSALVLMAPWLDLSLSGSSHMVNRVHPNPTEAELRRAAAWYVGEGDVGDPLVSPVGADLAGLPPLLLQTGSNDVLCDDSELLAERAKAAGVAVTLSIAEGMWHVFQHADCPEARAAVQEAAVFVNNAPPAEAVA